jgi:hypothetical protein
MWPQLNLNSVAPADYYDWRPQTRGFQDRAAWRYWQFNLTGEHGGLPERVSAQAGSWNLFPLMGVNAVIRRTFRESEDRLDTCLIARPSALERSGFEMALGADRGQVLRLLPGDGSRPERSMA